MTVCGNKDCNKAKDGLEACDRCVVEFVYTCGTCRLCSKIHMNELIGTITTLTISTSNRTWKKPVFGFDLTLLFFTIHDLDSGRFELVKSWMI
jgi:hypothetical protein